MPGRLDRMFAILWMADSLGLYTLAYAIHFSRALVFFSPWVWTSVFMLAGTVTMSFAIFRNKWLWLATTVTLIPSLAARAGIVTLTILDTGDMSLLITLVLYLLFLSHAMVRLILWPSLNVDQ